MRLTVYYKSALGGTDLAHSSPSFSYSQIKQESIMEERGLHLESEGWHSSPDSAHYNR